MAGRRGPTLRTQWLGKQLRELREAAKLTLRDAGEYIQRDPATISRIEGGLVPARTPDVIALLNLYGINDESKREGMERLSREVWHTGWWDGYTPEALGGMLDRAWLESRAERIRVFEPMVIPGLFQTRAYASAVITTTDVDAHPERIQQWLEFRMARQRMLESDPHPRLEIILDESVLHRAIGGARVMFAQLRRLAAVSERPDVTVRIIPFSAGAHASPEGGFQIFDMPDPYPDVAYAETRGGALYAEADNTRKFMQAYDSLHTKALPPVESGNFIRNAARRFG
ncbi:transcriptional regulator [Acrocarpospora phusangensis]|uniref:Transcriptional regulator n=1 Tax=Acrocarpospora phusangensis TaxID=1070424 RepID=A0A919QII4_9ACTN|nr:helix-turn-helix transcriptional regulator [Acrocarpospora phusangensis]GIH27010.1 transcriptional regulator [Acrocarpospora phusangensis]